MVEEIDQGSEEVRAGQHRGIERRQELHLCAAARELEAVARRRVRARVHQRDDRRYRVPMDAGRRRGAAGGRHVVAHSVAPDRRVEVRRDLRRRAEEHGPGGSDAGDRPQGSARSRARDHAVGISLEGAGGGRFDAEHAADVRHLHRGNGVRMAARAGRAGCDRTEEHREGEAAVRRARCEPALLQPGTQGRSLAYEHSVQAARRIARWRIPERRATARLAAVEGAPLGRRHARIDLQRDADRRRAGAGRLSARVRARDQAKQSPAR